MRILVVVTFFCATWIASAQTNRLALIDPIDKTVAVKVVVLDEENGLEPLAFASVIIEETGKENTTDLNGEFKTKLVPGSYNFEIQFVGYETKKLSNIEVLAGQSFELKTALQALQLTPDVNFDALFSEKSEN